MYIPIVVVNSLEGDVIESARKKKHWGRGLAAGRVCRHGRVEGAADAAACGGTGGAGPSPGRGTHTLIKRK